MDTLPLAKERLVDHEYIPVGPLMPLMGLVGPGARQRFCFSSSRNQGRGLPVLKFRSQSPVIKLLLAGDYQAEAGSYAPCRYFSLGRNGLHGLPCPL